MLTDSGEKLLRSKVNFEKNVVFFPGSISFLQDSNDENKKIKQNFEKSALQNFEKNVENIMIY